MSRFVVRHPFHVPGGGVMKQRGDELSADEVETLRDREPHLLEQNCIRSGSPPAVPATPAARPAPVTAPAAVRTDDSK